MEDKKDFYREIFTEIEPKLNLENGNKADCGGKLNIEPKLDLQIDPDRLNEQVKFLLEHGNKAVKSAQGLQDYVKTREKVHELISGYLVNPRNPQSSDGSILKSKLEKEIELKKQLEGKIKEQEEEKKLLQEELKKASMQEEEKKKLEEELEQRSKEQEAAREELRQRSIREKELEEEISQLKNQYKDKLEQTKKAVGTLRQPAKEMQEAKTVAKERVGFFNDWARYSIIGSVIGFILYILSYCSIIFCSNKIDTSGYFVMIFPVIFPIIIALALYRQTNIKTKEILEIDKRLILIHEITQALEAVVEINQNNPSLIDEKTESILNRLVDNILSWNKPKETEKESDNLLPKEIVDAIETIKKFSKSEK